MAVELDGPGYEDEGDIATFVTPNRFGGGAVHSVDDLAKQHTSWRDVAEMEGIDAGDPLRTKPPPASPASDPFANLLELVTPRR